jgi:AAA15 family ATPase/GTPase
MSFKDEMTISFEATKDKSLEQHHVIEVAKGVRLNKLAIVYGANASGKSNLISAINYLINFWYYKASGKDESTHVIPFLLDYESKNKPTEFVFTFYINNTKFVYSLELTRNFVLNESMYSYPGSQPSLVFSRKLVNNISKIDFNNKFKLSSTAKEELELKCLPNISVFVAYSQVNVNIEILETVSNWLLLSLRVPIVTNTNLTQYTKEMILSNPAKKDFLLDFLKKADFNIHDFDIKLYKADIPKDKREKFINSGIVPESMKKEVIETGSIFSDKTEFIHKTIDSEGNENFFPLSDLLQSQGTIRALGLSGVLSDINDNNIFTAIDEIESSLHPKLIELFIEEFLKQGGQSQLLLTTHYDGLLEQDDLLRKDNIWFTNKRQDGSTELYSLSDFNGLSRISSLQKAYKFGKFGAIPNI